MERPIEEIRRHVMRQIHRFEETKNASLLRAQLAYLRRGIGKNPGAIPEIWEMTLGNIPDSWMSRDGKPTREENAIHTALTYYALHQQSKDIKEKSMHEDGVGLGKALARMIKSEEDFSRIKRRFDMVATANSFEELAYHMRGAIQLLKFENIGMDYGLLAQDIYRYQFPTMRDGVRLKWGEDFYQFKINEEQKEHTNSKGEEDEK